MKDLDDMILLSVIGVVTRFMSLCLNWFSLNLRSSTLMLNGEINTFVVKLEQASTNSKFWHQLNNIST